MRSSVDLPHVETTLPTNTSFVLLDACGMVISLDKAWNDLRKKFSWPGPEVVVGHTYPGELLPPYKPVDDFNQLLRNLMAGSQERYVFTCPHKYRNKTVKAWVEVQMEAHKSPITGAIDGVVLRHEDITERVVLRDELAGNLGIYESMFMHLSEGIVIHDQNGVVKTANPAAENILGLSADQIRDVSFCDSRWHIVDGQGEPLSSDQHPVMVALTTGETVREFVMGVHQSVGDITWIKANADVIRNKQTGKVSGVLVLFCDITAERTNQHSLHELQERLQLAVDAAHMGIWDWTLENNNVYWDTHLYRLFGYFDEVNISPAEAWIRGIHPEDRKRIKKELNDLAKRKGTDSKADYRVRWPDGSLHYLRTQARATLNDAGDLIRVVGATREITDEVMYENRLKRQAYTDTLTGISNRVRLNLFLETAIARSYVKQSQLGVIVFDLDHFKNINDSFGHPMGDRLLISVVERISALLPERSEFARLGGDEFAVVLQDIEGEKYINDVAKKLSMCFGESFCLRNGPAINTNISAGISLYPKHGRNAMEILKSADLAMHSAKRLGRSSIMLYDVQMANVLNERLSLEYNLRNAILSEEFELFYQPFIDLQSGDVVGCESLIRWRDKEGKFIPPLVFIPTAEECGLINELGMWVIATSIKQWKAWENLHTQMRYISVNVSPVQLKDVNFSQTLIALVGEYKVEPKYIQLEITEGTFLQESLTAESQLKTLADAGFRLAIDDFGTGYSSLAYLKRFAVDVIKIDRSFIIDLEESAVDRDIVSAILAMNKTLGFETLVEGVETENQAKIISDLGCGYAQGYLYGRPTFSSEFTELYVQNIKKYKTI